MADLIYRRRRSGWRLVLGLMLCVVGAIVPTRGFANFDNGNTLLEICDDKVPYVQGICIGYAVGIAEVLSSSNGVVNGYRACLPKGATKGQVRDIVVKYLRSRPEERHFAAAGLVAHALEDAFPCK